MKKIYLASPYTHENRSTRVKRFVEACKAAAEIMSGGHACFSPIAHSHPIAGYMGNHNDGKYWLEQDTTFLDSWADEVWVLMTDGWLESKGIKREIEIAQGKNIPVEFIEPNEEDEPWS